MIRHFGSILVLLIFNNGFVHGAAPTIINGAAPTIINFNPFVGTNGTRVEINGTGFIAGASVKIGRVEATNIIVNSPNSITATVGSGTDNDFISVTTSKGMGSTENTKLGAFENGKFESYCNPAINIEKSLAINDPLVLGHPNARGPNGVWSFNFLMSQMAPTGTATSVFIKKWFINWRDTKNVNKQPCTADTSSITSVLNKWKRLAGGPNEFDGTLPLDLSHNQITLSAIVFRPDLDNTSSTPSAGEGRFVFALNESQDEVIFEFKLPVMAGTIQTSANQWNNLILALSLPDKTVNKENYIERLRQITDRFSKKTFSGVAGMQNGSGINQVRTNAKGLEGGAWALREFRLTSIPINASAGIVAADIGELVSVTTVNNPAERFNKSGSEVEIWAKNNTAELLNGTASFDSSTLGGRAVSQSGPWSFGSTISPSVKKAFDMSTCRGCHSPNVNLNSNRGAINPFLQASVRGFASFMTGTTTGKVANPIVFSSTQMPGGFSSPFTFKGDGSFSSNVDYSDLHGRAHNLIKKLIAGWCR